ncbi:hypothetical protein AUK22_04280 [bacterium CG2_30_54_10]|nr:MAG: hypothetical protein AUK22_04280 [bacterium CG2_30_54_10]
MLVFLVGGLFLFFAGYSYFILRLSENIPALEITVSLPGGWKAGETQEIVFYPRPVPDNKQVSLFSLNFSLSETSGKKKVICTSPVVQIQDGCYSAQIVIPPGTPEGPFQGTLNLPGMFDSPLAKFNIRIDPALAVLVLPPDHPAFPGDALEFSIAALDLVSGKLMAHFPIRARMFPPGGFEIANRVLTTSGDGIGRIEFRLPGNSPKSDHQFSFSAGKISTSIAIPIEESGIHGLGRMARSLAPWLKAFSHPSLPFPFHFFANNANRMSWENSTAASRSTILAYCKDRKLDISFSPPKLSPFHLEVWVKNRLFSTHYQESASEGLRIPFNFPVPRNFPVRLRIWEASGSRSIGEDVILPPESDAPIVAPLFKKIAECFGISPTDLYKRLLSFPAPQPLRFHASIRKGALSNHLQILADVLLIIFPISLAGAFLLLFIASPRRFSPGSYEGRLLRSHLAVATVLYLFYFLGFWISQDSGNTTSLVSLAGFALLAYFWFRQKKLRSLFRLSGSFLLVGMYMALMMVCGQLYRWLGLDASLIFPVNAIFISSLVSVPVFFLLIGAIHISNLSHRVFSLGNDLGSRILMLLSAGWKSVAVMATLLVVFFLLLFWMPERFSSSAIPASLLEVSTNSVSGNPGPTPSEPQTLAWKVEPKAVGAIDKLIEMVASPTFKLFPDEEAPNPGKPRFLMLTQRKEWAGRPIKKIEVLLEIRDFWNEIVEGLKTSSPTLSTMCQETRARCYRFSHLDPDEQAEEIPVLEANLGDIANFLLQKIRSQQPLTPSVKQNIEDALFSLGKIVFVDPTLEVHSRAIMVAGKPSNDQTPEAGLSFASLDTDSDRGGLPLLPEQLNECFQPGGELVLSGPKGNLSIPISADSFTLARGTSFRKNFKIEALGITRTRPLLLRLSF